MTALCAHNYGSHVTENQVGIDIFIANNHQNTRDTLLNCSQFAVYTKWSLIILKRVGKLNIFNKH